MNILEKAKNWAIKLRASADRPQRNLRVLNSLPSSFLPSEGDKIRLTGLSLTAAKAAVEAASGMGVLISHIGHDATAHALSTILEREIIKDRSPAPAPAPGGDLYLIAATVMPRRLDEGERLTEAEILALPVRWVLVGDL